MASGFSHCVVVSLALLDVERADLSRVLADDLPALAPMNLSPRLIGVYFDTFCDVVTIEAHSGHQKGVVLLSEFLMILYDEVECSDSLGARVPHLRPVVAEALGHDRYELRTEALELVLSRLVRTFLGIDSSAGYVHSIDDEVTNFTHEPVDVVDSPCHNFQDSVQLKLVEVSTDSLNDILHDAHASF